MTSEFGNIGNSGHSGRYQSLPGAQVILHSHVIGEGPALVVLHGLFGSWENWGSQMRKLADRYRVIGLDLANHGASGHTDAVSYDDMADDVVQTLSSLEVTDYHLLGHSMGGKVAMTIADRTAEADSVPELRKLIVVDIAPRVYKPHHQEIIAAMLGLDTRQLASRAAADKALQPAIAELAVRQFILKNLERNVAGGFRWRLNLAALATGYTHLLGMPESGSARFASPVLVLRGSASGYVTQDDEALLATRYPDSQVVTIAGAGHWPHASHAAEVHAALVAFLAK